MANSTTPAVWPLNDLGQGMNNTSPETTYLAFILGALQGGGGSSGGINGSGLPYGADTQVITNVAAGPATIKYYSGGPTGTLLKTRTFTYGGSGGDSASDQLEKTVDS